MRRFVQCCVAAVGFFVALGAVQATGSAEAPPDGGSEVQRLQRALDDMHRWLDRAQWGQGWRRFLRSEELQSQRALGDNADPGVVSRILDRYASGAAGLDGPRFVAVRRALQAWRDQLPVPEPDQLPDAARAAKEEFVPVSAEQLQRARARLTAASDRLQRFLARGGPDVLAGWQSYFRWQQLQQQLQQDQPDPGVLRQVVTRFYRDQQGLERPEFLEFREVLRDYANAVYVHTTPEIEQLHAERLNELAEHLEAYLEEPTEQTAFAIGARVGWLYEAGQAPALVRAIQHHFWQPNVHVQISERVLSAGIEEDVDQLTPIHETILGAQVVGTARTRGRVSLHLVPYDDHGMFDIRMRGRAHSTSVAYSGPAAIHSVGVTPLHAAQRLAVTHRGLQAGAAVAKARTHSTLTGVDANLKLIRKIAWNQAHQSLPQAEQAASQRAQQQAAQQLDQRTSQAIDEANRDYQQRVRNPLIRQDAYPERFQTRSTRQHLLLRLLQVTPYQLAAPGEPPALAEGHDLAVRLHQSAARNFSEPLLGGQTFTDQDMARLALELTGEAPDEDPEVDPWSITFSAWRPVSVEFDDQQFRISLRGRRFTRGPQVLADPMEIAAVYSMELTPTGARLTRVGDVEAEYDPPRRLGARQVAFKTFVRRRFEEFFQDEFTFEGFRLPGPMERAGLLQIRQLDSAQGWLTLGWQEASEPVRTVNTAND